jgi:hypothetical protein
MSSDLYRMGQIPWQRGGRHRQLTMTGTQAGDAMALALMVECSTRPEPTHEVQVFYPTFDAWQAHTVGSESFADDERTRLHRKGMTARVMTRRKATSSRA